jgi:hypothetical protein
MAREAAVVIELAPSLAEVVFGILPTVVGVALAAPEEIVAVTVPTVVVPIVAAASTGSVGVFVVVEQQQRAQLALCDHCECASRCITPGGLPMQ